MNNALKRSSAASNRSNSGQKFIQKNQANSRVGSGNQENSQPAHPDGSQSSISYKKNNLSIKNSLQKIQQQNTQNNRPSEHHSSVNTANN